ncbi:nitrate- and nitrite sensing domain-containing protein [Microbulbifer aggregans]|uniref:nitrate- and nitrite sensing domain-containing protein n=1 Tax=Microbulbifer aggregans TaxID=1769779 RepID=UPI001CFED381|nr:nitrate- and nitrite sensing domain-containing protein [Microbulbifer aggregans]
MSAYCDDAEKFLLAAKRAEIQALERLCATSELVTTVSELVHQLQRERGISNIYLVSDGARFKGQRETQIQNGELNEQCFRQLLHDHYLNRDEQRNMRLLNSIAYTLHGLDGLPGLREQVGSLAISALDATSAYCRVVAGLLAVVFEAADVADDPEVTRSLVALFNFMQAKEFAGQERAWGAIGFAGSHFDASLHDRLSQLQECQQSSLAVFTEFAIEQEKARWEEIESGPAAADLQRLRQIIVGLKPGEPIAADISEIWYELATERIDSMHGLEDSMAARLLAISRKRVSQAQAELARHYARLQELKSGRWPEAPALTMLFDPAVPGLTGSVSDSSVTPIGSQHLAHSLYDLIRAQVAHIREVSEELEQARRALSERKQIERAKGVLMRTFKMNEDDAYRTMQQRAMEMNLKLVEVAEKILEMGQRESEKNQHRDSVPA